MATWADAGVIVNEPSFQSPLFADFGRWVAGGDAALAVIGGSTTIVGKGRVRIDGVVYWLW
jgi:hypothetical protein